MFTHNTQCALGTTVRVPPHGIIYITLRAYSSPSCHVGGVFRNSASANIVGSAISYCYVCCNSQQQKKNRPFSINRQTDESLLMSLTIIIIVLQNFECLKRVTNAQRTRNRELSIWKKASDLAVKADRIRVYRLYGCSCSSLAMKTIQNKTTKQ